MKSPTPPSDIELPGNSAGATAEGLPAAAPMAVSPRKVIRGESSSEPGPVGRFHALTDFLNCTFRLADKPEAVGAFFQKTFACVGRFFGPAVDRGRGKYGYARSFELGDSGALFCAGGQRGTALLSLSGTACNLVPSWPALVELLRDEYQARITRWDGAVDDFFGVHPVDEAVALYRAGAFATGGNRPSCSQRGNWIECDGTGRTFYVGKRENGKLLRVYEKGLQFRPRSGNPWVRWEVELHNVDRVIPWEALFFPGKFFVGAYPKALGWAQEEMCQVRTLQHEAEASYGHLAHHASIAYGALINVMLTREGSAENVIEALRRPGAPARLRFPTLPDGTEVFP